MKTLILNLCLATGLAFSAAACGGGGGGECDSLAKTLCDGKDEAHCKKTSAWLKSEMTGPDGKEFNGKQADLVCKMISADSDSLAAYKKQAALHVK